MSINKIISIILNGKDDASPALKSVGSSMSAVEEAGRKLISILGPLAGAIAVREVVEATTAWEGYQNALKAITGDSTSAAAELEYIQQLANRLGLDLQSTADAYVGFSAATKGAGIASTDSKAIFESVASAMTVLGKSSDDTSGALKAIEQMFSKGKVSAEELRGQLGERLPGAFNLFADSMGISTSELDKMLQKGDVIAKDTLPKVAEALMKAYGPGVEDAAESTRAAINRFNSELFNLKLQVGEAGIIDAFVTALETASGVLNHPDFKAAFNDLSDAIDRLKGDMGGTTGVIEAIVKAFEILALGAQTVMVPIQLMGDVLGAVFAAIATAADGDLKGAWAILQDPTPGENFRANMAGLEQAAARVAGSLEEPKKATEELSQATSEFGPNAQAFIARVHGQTEAVEQAEEPTKKLAEANKNVAKEAKDAADRALKLTIELEKLASNERIKNMEFAVNLNTAALEADQKKVVAIFDSIDTAINSTGDLLGNLFGSLTDVNPYDVAARRTIDDMIDDENRRRDEAFRQQKELTKTQIDLTNAKLERLQSGDALITVSGDGLAPELEAFMWKILERIQIEAAADQAEFLLGV